MLAARWRSVLPEACQRKTHACEAVTETAADGETRFKGLRVVVRSPGPALALMAASLLLESLIYEPLHVWPLAYICLVPWLVCACAHVATKRVFWYSYLLGLAFFLINMFWMYYPTGPGYVLLSAYLGMYFPFMAIPIRHAFLRRNLNLTFVVPAVWVGAECVRGFLLTGFPWFFLAHSQYRCLTEIQISDFVGAYGVSFVVAMVNGWIAQRILRRPCSSASSKLRRWIGPLPSAVSVGAALAATFVYGIVRLSADTISDGPTVAVVQGNYPLSPDPEVYKTQPGPAEKAEFYWRTVRDAASHRPDLYLFPETPWPMYLNQEFIGIENPRAVTKPENVDFVRNYVPFSRRCYDTFQALAASLNAYFITGSVSLIFTPTSVLSDEIKYNSAFVFAPGGGRPQRYDKIHLVMFGEAVPFRYGRLRFLYLWLNRLTPWGQRGEEYSLTPGKEHKVMAIQPASQPGETYRFGIPICYEDAIAEVCRKFVIGPDSRKRVDFLLNVSNDGWFNLSAELPQHLAICAFRAVENRVGIARAVNTGISGFIDPNGRIYGLVEVGGRVRGPEVAGYSVQKVKCDSRQSFYSSHGDWFAYGCALMWALLFADSLVFGRTWRPRHIHREVVHC